jgi:hypothetical protein
VIQVIRETNIIAEFPDKTEGDLYLWVLDHQRYLESQEGIPLLPPGEAARDFFGDENEKPSAKAKKVKTKSRKTEKRKK